MYTCMYDCFIICVLIYLKYANHLCIYVYVCMAAGYNVRAANHENLLAALKEVNQMIQRSANLRAGKAKARVVADCRAAVKVCMYALGIYAAVSRNEFIYI